jgi:hypothetical protein
MVFVGLFMTSLSFVTDVDTHGAYHAGIVKQRYGYRNRFILNFNKTRWLLNLRLVTFRSLGRRRVERFGGRDHLDVSGRSRLQLGFLRKDGDA